jgi:hypothetical protein
MWLALRGSDKLCFRLIQNVQDKWRLYFCAGGSFNNSRVAEVHVSGATLENTFIFSTSFDSFIDWYYVVR